ncbi:hypothetical protein QWZ04_00760 [Vibrio tapetis subsp. quintayensis]|uniref:hypothetical protein n=1 Tax=Vibrio tapetis TaxID=52443 RepID=UPI0025B43C92|nr:hypothetical protein [Vibrio tapetis]MDN3678868.1 hypothetical protein [Vibrio tapetis subsp. quintayensis]
MDPPSIEKMDTNGDGELQKDELRGPLVDDFDTLDLDESGGLSSDEVPEPPAKRKRTRSPLHRVNVVLPCPIAAGSGVD